MIKPTLYVPAAEFRRVLTEYANGSMKSIKDTFNGRLLDILIKAYQNTRIAKRSDLERELGITAYKSIRSRKTGKTRRGAFVLGESNNQSRQSFASILTNARRIARGEQALGGEELAHAARRMVAARLRSIGFIRSGWIPGLRIFNKLRDAAKAGKVRGSLPIGTREVVGQPKGTGTPATSILHPVAEASNTTKVASVIATEALQQAFNDSYQNMLAILRGNLEEVRNRYANKVIR